MKRLLRIVFVLLMPLMTLAQNVEFNKSNFPDKKDQFKGALKALEKGDEFYRLGRAGYRNALEQYQIAYDFNPNNADLNNKIGICYLNGLDKARSVTFFEKAYKLDPKIDKKILYYIARAYHLNLRWNEAIDTYTKYKNTLTQNELNEKMENSRFSNIEDITKKIQECRYGIEYLKDTVRVLIRNLGPNINTSFNENSPVISIDESEIIYTARRDVTTGGQRDPEDDEFMEDIYQSHKKTGDWTPNENMGPLVNSPENDAAVGLSADAEKLFIYKGSNGGDLYECLKKGSSWTKPTQMSKIINTPYHESSACYTGDQRTIIFVSDRPDLTRGGRDVLRTTMNKKGNWEEPVNIGPVINTIYDEEGVYFHPNGTLYFSSKGHSSMGGYDIFKSHWNDSTKTWSEPVNLGYPINTPDDEVFFVVNGSLKHGYYASARKGGYGTYDIYMLDFLGPVKQMQLSTEDNLLASIAAPVIEKQMQPEVTLKSQLTILKGVVYDEKTKAPLEGSIDIIDNEKNEIIATFLSNSTTGKYLIPLPSGKNYGISVSCKGYLFHSENVDIPASNGYQEITRDIPMVRIEVGNSIILRNVFFDFDKATLRQASINELQRLITLLKQNPTIRIELGSHTDSKGSDEYNVKLSAARSKSVVEYLIANGIPESRLEHKGYGETHPIAPNTYPDGSDNPEGRQLNRRTEAMIITK